MKLAPEGLLPTRLEEVSENISRPSAFKNTCKPGAIENIIKYYTDNPIISNCHRKQID